jgi:hypothetical protein
MDRLIRSIDQPLDGQSHATKGSAELGSNQVERLTDNNRAPFTLLDNTKGGQAPRRKAEQISARAPFILEGLKVQRPSLTPSLATERSLAGVRSCTPS